MDTLSAAPAAVVVPEAGETMSQLPALDAVAVNARLLPPPDTVIVCAAGGVSPAR